MEPSWSSWTWGTAAICRDESDVDTLMGAGRDERAELRIPRHNGCRDRLSCPEAGFRGLRSHRPAATARHVIRGRGVAAVGSCPPVSFGIVSGQDRPPFSTLRLTGVRRIKERSGGEFPPEHVCVTHAKNRARHRGAIGSSPMASAQMTEHTLAINIS